jgi:hypothetical protein
MQLAQRFRGVFSEGPVVPAARVGYASRGIVYVLVGCLALMAAAGWRSPPGTKDALKTLWGQPGGAVLLAAIAAGLLAFSLWRLVQAALDPDRYGAGLKGGAIRATQLISAAVHAALAFWAVQLAFGRSSGGGQSQDWIAWILQLPGGAFICGALGLAIVIAAGFFFVSAWKASFAKRLDCNRDIASWLIPLGRAGYASRGVAFLLIGGLIMLAAWTQDASGAGGLQDALQAVRASTFGWVGLGILGAGLLAFGAYGLAQSAYRRVPSQQV